MRSGITLGFKFFYGLIFLLLLAFSNAKAEGSKDLYPSGATGNRAYLYCTTNADHADSWPFKTTGTHYVYAEAGETIGVASSAQGKGGFSEIIITSPTGVMTSSTTLGNISNRAAELAGPDVGYAPFTIIVAPGQAGIWKIDFIPPNGPGGNRTFINAPTAANSIPNWSQGTTASGNGDVITAWDVSVKSKGVWITGRVYTNVLNLNIYQDFSSSTKGFDATNFILTQDGRAYRVKTNGNNGVAFTFFSNNNGFAQNGVPTYKSLNFSDNGVLPYIHDPRTLDDSKNITHKIFYNKPNADLPQSAPAYITAANQSTWLKNTTVLPAISNLLVTGVEGTVGRVSQKGANITFNSTTGGTFQITIPVAGGTNRVLTGVATTGANSIFWDAKDGAGNYVSAGTIISQFKTMLRSAEVHFPYIDMEINPQGIIIELTDNTLNYALQTTSTDRSVYSDLVYWDDALISGAGSFPQSSNPKTNLSGISSNSNGHKWGKYVSSAGSDGDVNSGSGLTSFGNNRSMDTWAYIQGSEVSQPIDMAITNADLKIESITPDLSQYFSTNQITYVIKVKNDGPSDITAGKFNFNLPTNLNIVSSTSQNATSGASSSNLTSDLNNFNASVNLTNQASIEFKVVAKIIAGGVNQIFPTEASILRPSDVTDPDATDPDSTTPVDPHLECKNGTATEGCNNIKYNTVNGQEICQASAITPVVYPLSGGTTLKTVNLPSGLTKSGVVAGAVTVSGALNSTGISSFLLETQGSDRTKTNAIIKVDAKSTITETSQDLIYCEGETFTHNITSSGTGDTYQWQYEDNGVWKNIDATTFSAINFTTNELKINAVPLTINNVNIRVMVTTVLGCVSYSTPFALTINALPVQPTVTVSGGGMACGGSVTLTSSAITGNQWLKDGSSISGATNQTYSATESGNYTVVVTSSEGCPSPVSAAQTITVNAVPVQPTITVTGSATVCGGSVTLTSSAITGNQWLKDGSSISGATDKTYSATESGNYTVIVTSSEGCSSPISAAQSITVNAVPVQPTINITGSATVCGGSVTLTSSAITGNQWLKDGSSISGATNQTYSATESGNYTVIVTSSEGCSSLASAGQSIVINPIPATPTISISGLNSTCAGGSIVLTSSPANSYQWLKDGSSIPGATDKTYSATESGNYTVIVTSSEGCSSLASAGQSIVINPIPTTPTISISGLNSTCAGGSIVLTSSPANSYQWLKDGSSISGATNQTYSATESGNYTVIVTSSEGCSSLASVGQSIVINPIPATPTISISGLNSTCAGGSIVLTSSPANSYQWLKDGSSIPGATDKTYSATESGNYTVIVTSSEGCSSLASAGQSIVINPIPATPTISISGLNSTCAGGSIVLTSNSDTGNQWLKDGSSISGATDKTYSATESGNYTVIVTSSEGCSSLASAGQSIVINPIPATPTISISGLNSTCAGGSIVLTSSPANSYQWLKDGSSIPGATDKTYSATESGNYTVIVTSSEGCSSLVSAGQSVVINPIPATPTISISGLNSTCAGGSIVLTSSPANSYQWLKDGSSISGATDKTYSATESGNYTVIVTSSEGCSSLVSAGQSVVINPIPTTPTISISGLNSTCAGGSIVLTSSPANSYQWLKDGSSIPGATDKTYSATESGNYTVIVTSSEGCSSLASAGQSIVINPIPATPTISISGLNSTCAGGSIVLTSSPANSYQWLKDGSSIPGATDKTYSATESGNYTVIVTSSEGCSSLVSAGQSVVINPIPTTPTISISGLNSTCAGGSIVLTSSPANSYQWLKDGSSISGATDKTYSATESGNYTVIVTSSEGCSSLVSAGQSVVINPIPTTPTISISGLNSTCAGGSIVLTSSPANSYQWLKDGSSIPGATDKTYSATESGNYTVIVTSSEGCSSLASAGQSIVINPIPATPTISISGLNSTCAGGSIVLTSSPANSYQWLKDGSSIPGATDKTYSATESGNYTVIVTSSEGCSSLVSAGQSVVINPIPTTPTISISGLNSTCAGGSIVLTSSPANSYQWLKDGSSISGATDKTYSATESGNYTVIVTSSEGCSSLASAGQSVVINPIPATPTISISGLNSTCAGGSIVLTSSPANSYQWLKDGSSISGATDKTYSATESGNYTVIVTSSEGCSSPASAGQSVVINPIPATPTISISGLNSTCAGGSIVLTSSPANSYQWLKDGSSISGATDKTYSATESGNYTVIVTSSEGCSSLVSAGQSVVINPIPATPTISISGLNSTCAGGSIVLTSSPANSYQWLKDGSSISGATDKTYSATESGNYTVIVTSSEGCSSPASAGQSVVINPIPATPTISISGLNSTCAGGSIVLTSSPANSYQWLKDGSSISGATDKTYSATKSGNYTVIVTSSEGCSSLVSAGQSVVINPIPATPTISISGLNSTCAGGSIVLTSSPANSYQWLKDGSSIPGATDKTYSATESGSYTVIVTSSEGCSSLASAGQSVFINPIPTTPTISISGLNSTCAGGSIVLTSSPANSYQWLKDGSSIPGATDKTYSATESGSYTVIVTSSEGCSSLASAGQSVVINPIPTTPTISISGLNSTCAGGSIVLTSNSDTGNQWLKDGSSIPGATDKTYSATESGNYTVIVTSSEGCPSPISAAQSITVNAVPVQPTINITGSATVCGGSVTLTSSAIIGNQWLKDGSSISGATNQTYSASESGNYTVIVKSAEGCSSPVSAGQTITVNVVPVQPTITVTGSATVCGGSVTLTSSSATGNQWYKDNTLIAGASDQTYTATVSGNYTVIVKSTEGCSSPVSVAQTITVNTVPAQPAITVTGNATVCGGSVTLTSSSATGNQWYKDNTLIAGATDQTYSASESGNYTVIVKSVEGCSSPVSAGQTITVNTVPAQPAITVTGSATVCGGSVTLTSSSATGNQWYKDNTLIAGATDQTYTATASGNYTVIVKSAEGCSSPISAAQSITVNAVPAQPAITVTGSATVCGGSVTLTSSSATGNQWYKDNTLIAGAIDQTYTASESGNYTVIVKSAEGCSSPISAGQTIKVNTVPAQPAITVTGSATVCGGSVRLTSSSATGNQWYKDNTLIAGASDQTYTATVSGNYTVIVKSTEGCSSPVSVAQTITVNTVPAQPAITVTGNATVCGGSVTLTSSSATGNQWYKDNTLIAGATDQTYSASESGNYTVIVKSVEGCLSPVSVAQSITVNAVPVQPTINITGSATVCGGSVTLTSSAITGNQWLKDGSSIPGATDKTYSATESGNYTVIVTSSEGCSSLASAGQSVVINPIPTTPTISISGLNSTCAGGSIVLTSSPANSYQWLKDGSSIPGATDKTYSATESGNYTVIVTSSEGCSSPVSATQTITVNTVPVQPTINITGNATVCGGSVTLTSSAITGNQWYKDNTLIAGATNQTYSATESGNYTIIVTSSEGCPSPISAAQSVTVNAVPAQPTINITGSATVCGGSVTLTSSSATGNQWYKDNTLIAGATNQTYSATESGNYTVVVTSSEGCPSPVSAAQSITVNAVPVQPTITVTGSATVCGGSVTLTSSSATGNQWYKDNTLIAGATDQTYTATASGNYTVIVKSAEGCSSPVSVAQTITVNTVPAQPAITVTGNATVCGGSVTLTSSSATGNQWYKDNTLIAGASDQTYSASESGNYTVIVKSAEGCSSPVSAGKTITVNTVPAQPAITVTGSATVCGGSVTLTSSSATGNQWYKDNTLIAGATDQTYTATASGNYTVIVKSAEGCSSPVSAGQTIKVNTVPAQPAITVTGSATVCGVSVTLTSSSATGNQWYKDNTLIAGATDQTYIASESGNYTVIVKSAEGCSSPVSVAQSVVINPIPNGFNDVVRTLDCNQKSFDYNLEENINNNTKGGNGVSSTFTWVVNSNKFGATNGSGTHIQANLINTTSTEQLIEYLVTPIAVNGGCVGKSFKIGVILPVCSNIEITKTADKALVSNLGDKINYTISVANKGQADQHNVKVSDPLLGGIMTLKNGDNGNGILESNEVWIYSGTYIVTQNDLNNEGLPSIGSGKIINTASVITTENPVAKEASAVVNIQNDPKVALIKVGFFNKNSNTITYTFKIINRGNVTLKEFSLKDDKLGFPLVIKPTVLKPGEAFIFTADYTITRKDIEQGFATNTATVSANTTSGDKVIDVSGWTESDDKETETEIIKYPIAVDDFAKTEINQKVEIPVVINDKAALVPLNKSSVEIKSQPSHGTLIMGQEGKVIYVPNRGFSGIDKFTYAVEDFKLLKTNEANVIVTIDPPALDIKNTFTPNGDGKNDTFKINDLEQYDAVDIAIFNRWGDEVYRNSNYKGDWDGSNLNEGTYFYIVKAKKGDVVKQYKSWLLLKR